jgi:two-component system chemotaxis sensor kinase CheA
LRAPLAPGGQPAAEAPPAAAPAWLPALLARHQAAIAAANAPLVALHYIPAPDCFFLGDDPLALLRAVPGLIAVEIAPRGPWAEPFAPFACNLVIAAITTAPEPELRQAFRFAAGEVEFAAICQEPRAPAPAAEATPTGEASRFLRVDAGRIDALVDIVGELIVAKNGLAEIAATLAARDAALGRSLAAKTADIDRLVGGLHRAAMAVRMTRLSRTVRRLSLLVRESAASLGKAVDFTIAGEEIEADKTIVDGLYEPLLHVLRNAIDHGIEPPEARRAAGKPATGRVALAAAAEAGRIVVTVTDDGAGIDPARIRAAALARGLRPEPALAAMDDAALTELLFAPGFSTAAAVTSLSGRGVGMDAVRSAVEALGGSVSLRSTQGAGTTLRMDLPQAVQITTIVTVTVAGARFGVPLQAISETLRLPQGAIRAVRGGEAFLLRGHVVPLLRLAALLSLDNAGDAEKALVVTHGGAPLGIAVEAVGERLDVMLRPMAGLLAGAPGVLGAALMGDGSVLMVLNIAELVG